MESLSSKIKAANKTLIEKGGHDAIGKFFSPDYVAHLTGQDVAGGHSVVRGMLELYQRAFPRLKAQVDILLEGTPSHINIVSLREQLGHVNGVGSIHDLHVWTLTSGVLAMSCHVVTTGDGFDHRDLLNRVNRIARDKFGIDHTTIQIEEANIQEGLFDSCNCHFGAWDSP